jgi:hypothetical protein
LGVAELAELEALKPQSLSSAMLGLLRALEAPSYLDTPSNLWDVDVQSVDGREESILTAC